MSRPYTVNPDDQYIEDEMYAPPRARAQPPPYSQPEASAPSEELPDRQDPDLDSINDPNQSFQSVDEGNLTSLDSNPDQFDPQQSQDPFVDPLAYINFRNRNRLGVRSQSAEPPKQQTQSGQFQGPLLSPIPKDSRLRNVRLTSDIRPSDFDDVRKVADNSDVNKTSQEYFKFLQRQLFRDLVDNVRIHAQEKIFSNKQIFNRPYIGPDDDRRPLKLQTLLFELFPNGCKQLDMSALHTLRLFLNHCAAVFDAIADSRDKHNLYSLARFLAISIVFGIDRALRSLNDKDNLMIFFLYDTADFFPTTIYDKPEINKKAPNLIPARDAYYWFFRIDDFDPQDKNKRLALSVTHHGLERPFPSSVLEPSDLNNPKIPDKQKELFMKLFGLDGVFLSASDSQKKQSDSAVLPDNLVKEDRRHQDPNSKVRPFQPTSRQGYTGPTSIPQQDVRNDSQQNQYRPACTAHGPPQTPLSSTHDSLYYTDPVRAFNMYERRRQMTCQNTTDEESDNYQDRRYEERRPQMSRPTSRSASRVSFNGRDTVHNISSEEEETEEEHQLEDSDDSDEDTSRAPIHLSRDENPYYGRPLSKAGHVYDQSKRYKELPPQEPRALQKAYEALFNLGLSPNNTRSLLETSTGVAQVISTLLDDKKQKRNIQSISPPREDQDFKLHSFDYRRDGKTVTQILGRRFMRTRFPTDAARKAMMKEIFQAVVNDPLSSVTAFKIALAQLGQIDARNIQTQEIQHQLATTLARPTYDDPDIVPPPILGENDLDSRVFKILQTRIGLEEKFSVEDLGGGALKSLLTNLASVITNAGLRESEAYALLRRITKGITCDTITSAEFEHKIPFEEFWINIQRTQRRASSTREYEKKLKNVLADNKIDNIETALNEIVVFNEKIHAKEPEPHIRKLLCQRNTLKDLRFFIRKHYSSFVSQVNTLYMDKLRQVALAKSIPSFINENIYHAGKTHLFLEVACEVLGQCEPDEAVIRSHSTGGHHGRNYVHAIENAYDQPKIPNQRPEERPGTPGFINYQDRRNEGRDQNEERRSNYQDRRNETPRPYSQNQGRMSRFGRRPNFRCLLCNVMGHGYRICRTYPTQQPSKEHCKTCGGQHQGKCISKIRITSDSQQQDNDRRTPFQAIVNEVIQQTDQQPILQRTQTPGIPFQQQLNEFNQQFSQPPPKFYQDYSQNRQSYSRNDYRPRPYSAQPYDRPRSQYNNGPYERRSQSGEGFRDKRFNNYRDGPRRFNNEERRGYSDRRFNNYQDQRGGFQDRRYNNQDRRNNYGDQRRQNNYEDRRPFTYRQRQGYYNNTKNGNDYPFDRSQSRNAPHYQDQLQNVTQAMQQQEQAINKNGIGNNGFQPLHQSAILSSTEGFITNHDNKPILSH